MKYFCTQMESYSNKIFSDNRLDYSCSYCGEGTPATRDHVPSRILLDSPFPENLPLVGCCQKCNSGFSQDEEYLAAVIECIIHSTSNPDLLSREKIKKVLRRNTKLRERIESSFYEEDPTLFDDIKPHHYCKIESERFENVLTKLAKGHVKFEHSTPMFENPDVIWFKCIGELSEDEHTAFFNIEDSGKVPEIGSRAFHKIYVDNEMQTYHNQWEIVQEGRYAYCVNNNLGETVVRIIISNYLACYIAWQ